MIIIKILIYFIISIISILLLYKVSNKDKEIAFILYISSFFPILNVFIIITSLITLIGEQKGIGNIKEINTKK